MNRAYIVIVEGLKGNRLAAGVYPSRHLAEVALNNLAYPTLEELEAAGDVSVRRTCGKMATASPSSDPSRSTMSRRSRHHRSRGR